MGKRLTQQKRGRGSPTYRAPSFRYKGMIKHHKLSDESVNGKIMDLITCPGHNSPLMQVKYDDGEDILMVAPDGIKVGDVIITGADAPLTPGNVLPLKNIPEGTSIYNIESVPGDGGKFVRTSGGVAKVVNKVGTKIVVRFPSSKQKEFNPNCRACVGLIAGSGRVDKPFVKAGTRHFNRRAKNKLYPSVSGVSMNSVDHPFGGSSSHHKGRPLQSGRNDPPGRKVGNLAPKKKNKK